MKTAAEHFDEGINRARKRRMNAGYGAGWHTYEREECIAAIEAAVAQERARWLAWATDLGYDEHELQRLL